MCIIFYIIPRVCVCADGSFFSSDFLVEGKKELLVSLIARIVTERREGTRFVSCLCVILVLLTFDDRI